MKRLAISLACVAVFTLTGCGKSKQDQLYGTWHETSEDAFDWTLTFNKDGSLTADVQMKTEGAPDHVAMTGSWKVADDKLIYTIDHSSYENEKFAGGTDTDTITSVDDKNFEAVDAKGKKLSFSRSN